MPKSRAANHLHRYKKVDLSRDSENPYLVYRCVKPACSHYIPLELAEGKLCECTRCAEPMLIDKRVLTGSAKKPMTHPHCSECVVRKKGTATDVAAISAFLKGNQV